MSEHNELGSSPMHVLLVVAAEGRHNNADVLQGERWAFEYRTCPPRMMAGLPIPTSETAKGTNIMKTIAMVLMALATALLLAACSESPAEGCWITHANGVGLGSQVLLPGNGEALAMNPGDSYLIWCARKIDNSSVGDIISEDQQTLRIAALPHDAELQIYPNERDTVYRGQPVYSSANV